jgi:micrococcal nuclease
MSQARLRDGQLCNPMCELLAHAPVGIRFKVGAMSCSWREDHLTTARSVLAVLAIALAGAASAGERCSALDGDTLRCGRERVRIEGLHAPELSEPGGQEARQRLQRRIEAGELVIDRKGRDRYGRTLGRAYVNGNRITQLDVKPKPRRATTRR